uniref:hypothetical protein n=1 Tax=Nonomuraea sp. CA-251285 TaxID=3240002 RepID=UPI003F493493
MTLEPPGLTGHVLDLSALLSLAKGESLYAREVARQAVVYGITLLVPATAAQYLRAYHRKQGARLLDLSVVLVSPLGLATVAAATPYTDRLDANTQRHAVAVDDREPRLSVLIAAHAVLLSKDRNWRLMTSLPHLYDGLGVRTEILP